MKTSEHGRALIKLREGVRLKAYRDSKQIPTIGVGHTSAAGPPDVHMGMVISALECDRILAIDLEKFEAIINKAVRVEVEQHEFDALVSICFNVGPKFAQSSCIALLNAGKRADAASSIMLWNKPAEIVKRRRTEQRQFLTPY